MAYSERLAGRVRVILGAHNGYTERKMFGGLCCMIFGHMCIGITGEDLMVRVGPAQYDKVLKQAHVRPMDFTGQPMKGLIFVGPQGIRTSVQLKKWVDCALKYVAGLPRK